MTGWKRALAWTSSILIGLALVGLGAYLAVTDLDRADKLASVVGAITAIAGFALSAYGVVLARRTGQPSVATEGQIVERVEAQTGVDVVDGVQGSVRLGTTHPPAAGQAAPQAQSTSPVTSGGQTVRDVKSGGHVRIIRRVAGDVDSAS